MRKQYTRRLRAHDLCIRYCSDPPQVLWPLPISLELHTPPFTPVAEWQLTWCDPRA